MEHDIYAESNMTGRDGLPVTANLSWDDNFYYCWLTSDYDADDLCLYWPDVFEHDRAEELIEEVLKDCKSFGLVTTDDLEYINRKLKQYCGDDSPSGFYIREGFMGANIVEAF